MTQQRRERRKRSQSEHEELQQALVMMRKYALSIAGQLQAMAREIDQINRTIQDTRKQI